VVVLVLVVLVVLVVLPRSRVGVDVVDAVLLWLDSGIGLRHGLELSRLEEVAGTGVTASTDASDVRVCTSGVGGTGCLARRVWVVLWL
jgi:hypothetical protein